MQYHGGKEKTWYSKIPNRRCYHWIKLHCAKKLQIEFQDVHVSPSFYALGKTIFRTIFRLLSLPSRLPQSLGKASPQANCIF